jgi:hypothetical protein
LNFISEFYHQYLIIYQGQGLEEVRTCLVASST